eukprot:5260106-Prymnesium_polylepis.1
MRLPPPGAGRLVRDLSSDTVENIQHGVGLVEHCDSATVFSRVRHPERLHHGDAQHFMFDTAGVHDTKRIYIRVSRALRTRNIWKVKFMFA